MKKQKNVIIRLPKNIHQEMIDDLRRQHKYAYERVGFLYSYTANIDKLTTVITCFKYEPVSDKNYIRDDSVGAKINSSAIREAMQMALTSKCGCFHVHLHDFEGLPSPSRTDKGLNAVVESIANVASGQAHGFLILSADGFYANIKMPNEKLFIQPTQFSVAGYPMQIQFAKPFNPKESKVYDRQSFLGERSQFLFENVRIGVVGLGGGGSHIVQQLAHIGIINTTVFDDDKTEDTNLNRLIGGWFSDIKKATLKTLVAKRMMKKILPNAKIECINDKWQNQPHLLQKCDIVIGCVDSYAQRQELEAECRRYLIPYIDIGMDVTTADKNAPYISGQVVLSMPGLPCMFCLGFLTEKKLGLEAGKYGATGGRPQVVWPNGVLASSAIGIMIDLITGWSGLIDRVVYLSYDGNLETIADHMRLKYASDKCIHFVPENTGPPKFKKI